MSWYDKKLYQDRSPSDLKGADTTVVFTNIEPISEMELFSR